MMVLEVETGEPVRRMDFDSFFRAQFPPVARAAALVTRDAGVGQELAQEAFLRAFQRWDLLESGDHARNFVYRVAINLARSHLRKHLRVRPFGLRGADEPATSGGVGRSDEWLHLVGALGALSGRQRACVVLVDLVDMDAASVAEVLGMSPSTVRVHLMRGRATLRARLGLPSMGDDDED